MKPKAHALNLALRQVMQGAARGPQATEKSRKEARRRSNRSGEGGRGGNTNGGGNAAAREGTAAVNKTNDSRVNEEMAANAMGHGGVEVFEPLLGGADVGPLARKQLEDIKNAQTAAAKARALRRMRAAVRLYTGSKTKGMIQRFAMPGAGPEDAGEG